MARFVFLTRPTYGSVHPTVAVVHDLVARGHGAVCYVPSRFAACVAEAGAVVRLYDVGPDLVEPPWPVGAHAMPMWASRQGHHVVPQLVDRIRRESADCLVYDSSYLVGRIARQVLGLPAIALHDTYALNEHFRSYASAVGLRTTAGSGMTHVGFEPGMPREDGGNGVSGRGTLETLPSVEALNIVFLPREFQIAGDTFDERYVFVGPAIHARPDDGSFPYELLDTDRPVIYVALGTALDHRRGFLRACIDAFGARQWRVVISSRGAPGLIDPARCPDNVVVTPFAPQLEVLSRAAVFVTHCGMTSTMEGLYYGVPMLGVPENTAQEMAARRVVELGAGLAMDAQSLTASALYEAVARVLAEPVYRDRARQMQRLVRAAGGHRRAADAMIRFCRDRADGPPGAPGAAGS